MKLKSQTKKEGTYLAIPFNTACVTNAPALLFAGEAFPFVLFVGVVGAEFPAGVFPCNSEVVTFNDSSTE